MYERIFTFWWRETLIKYFVLYGTAKCGVSPNLSFSKTRLCTVQQTWSWLWFLTHNFLLSLPNSKHTRTCLFGLLTLLRMLKLKIECRPSVVHASNSTHKIIWSHVKFVLKGRYILFFLRLIITFSSWNCFCKLQHLRVSKPLIWSYAEID